MSKPFLRWAGGKRKLLPKLLPFFPEKFDHYVEPFLGGGSVFFALAAEKQRRFKQAWLYDANADLINAFVHVRDNAINVIAGLRFCAELVPEIAFAESKYLFNKRTEEERKTVGHAIDFIILNRLGFNGVFRVNSEGKYNVPLGRRADGSLPSIIDDEYEATLRECSRLLQGAEIRHCDFSEIPSSVDTFWYVDPPYLKLEAGSFDTYCAGGFDVVRHEALCAFLRDRRENFVMSSSDTQEGRRIFQENGFKMHPIAAPRSSHGQLLANSFAKELVVTP